MEKILKKLKNKENLDFEESKSAFEILMSGKASEKEGHPVPLSNFDVEANNLAPQFAQ